MSKNNNLQLGNLGEAWAKKLGYKPRERHRYIQLAKIVHRLGGFLYVVSPMGKLETGIPDIEVTGPKNFAMAIWADPVFGEGSQLADMARLLYFYLVVAQEGKTPLLRKTWAVPYDPDTYACEQFVAGFLIPQDLIPKKFPTGQAATPEYQTCEAWRVTGVNPKYAEIRIAQL